jgi:hypothetical protein
MYSETLNSANAVNRSVNLQNYRGQTIRIAFRHHNTTDVFVLGIGNIKITKSTQSIDFIESHDYEVYADNGEIIVNTDQTEDIFIYDIIGNKVDAGRKSHFIVPTSGVYMVKIANHPARKVVVMR